MDTPPALTSMQLHVLRHLVVGATRRTIADQLHLGGRTVDRHVAEIKQALGTAERLCLGVRAIRSGSIDPQHPITQALPRRPDDDWMPPTTVRELSIVGLLAGGLSIPAAAARIGMSPSTIRGDLSRLMTANGAIDLTHAGALFEALRWTSPGSP